MARNLDWSRFIIVIAAQLIVWKNKTRLSVGVQDVTFTMIDEAL